MITLLLNERLAERQMTQAELSRRSGIRAATINDMCRNLCCRVNLDSIEIICNVLECDLCDIMTMHNEEMKAAEAAARRGLWIDQGKSMCSDSPKPEHMQRGKLPTRKPTKQRTLEKPPTINSGMQRQIEESEIVSFLQKIGIHNSVAGFSYLCTAFEIISQDESIIFRGNKGLTLYPKIAEKHNKTPAIVSGRMYEAIVEAWTNGDYTMQEKIYGFPKNPDKINPTIAEFLKKGYLYIRDGTDKE